MAWSWFPFKFFFLQPIFSAISTISSFAKEFAEHQQENSQLREKLARFDMAQEQLDAADKLAKEAWQQNESLQKELKGVKAELEKVVQLWEQEKFDADKAAKHLSK